MVSGETSIQGCEELVGLPQASLRRVAGQPISAMFPARLSFRT